MEKIETKARQAVFFTHLNLFGENPVEEEPHDDCTIPQKVHYRCHWRRHQDAVYWIKIYPEHKIRDCILRKRSHLRS